MLPNFAKLESKIEALEQWLMKHGQDISCIQEDVRVLRRGWAYQNGVAPKSDNQDNRFEPRKITRGPFALEETVTNTRLVSEDEILRGLQGRFSSDGFYANIGTNPFKISVTFAAGNTYSRTVPPNATYAITSFVTTVQIDLIGSLAATFQLELR